MSTGPSAAADLRAWLGRLEERDQLLTVRGAERDLEIGAITELFIKRNGSPTLLFDEIPGFPTGYRIASNTLSHSSEHPQRAAMSLGLDEQISTTEELVYAIKAAMPRWEEDAKHYAPRIVSTGPVLDRVYRGDEVDVLKYPAPLWHEQDGARYIGTGCAVITRDPETEQLNIGSYRVQVHDSRRVGIYMAPTRHGLADIRKYHAQGQGAPVAISLGQHPLFAAIGGRPISRVSGPSQEFGYIGAIRGSSVAVIAGELTGLPIPADAELAVEGFVPVGAELPEGPFGELSGYYGEGSELAPYLDVERVYERTDPIILGSLPGQHPSYGTAVFSSALWLRRLEILGVSGVKMIASHRLASTQMAAVSITQRYAGHAREVGHIIAQMVARAIGRYVVVVDDDIDVTDIAEVTFAMATRSDPATDIDIVRKAYTQRLDPMLPPGTPPEDFYNSRAIIDACVPFDRRESFPSIAAVSPELKAKVLAKWGTPLGIH